MEGPTYGLSVFLLLQPNAHFTSSPLATVRLPQSGGAREGKEGTDGVEGQLAGPGGSLSCYLCPSLARKAQEPPRAQSVHSSTLLGNGSARWMACPSPPVNDNYHCCCFSASRKMRCLRGLGQPNVEIRARRARVLRKE